jgi:hypothetical protein
MKGSLLLIFFWIGIYSNAQNEYSLELQSFNGESPKMAFGEITSEIDISHRYINDSILSFKSFTLFSTDDMTQIVQSYGYELKDFQLLAQTTGKEIVNLINYQTKACCDITIDLFDSFGDGWNGATLEVVIDGTSTNYSVTSGFANTVVILLCDGQNLEIIYNSGSWESENSYTITRSSDVLFSDGPNPLTGSVYNSNNICSTPSSPTDCDDAQMVCSAASFNGNAAGSGNNQELNSSNSGCLSIEHQSSWYYINVGSNGILEMAIAPSASDDYDFAIWGPFTETTANANCSPTSGPIRCSWAAGSGISGLGNGASDPSEGAFGNRWVAPLNVQQDEVYILLIDNYSASNSPFNLSWGGNAGLECTEVTLPVALTSFEGVNKNGINLISWETETELNNDYFTVEYSSDGLLWNNVDHVSGAGYSTTPKSYTLGHRNFTRTINYYRLTQVDFDGKREVFPVISIDNLDNKKLVKRLNTLGQEVSEGFKGIVIEYYDDHTIEKRIYQ